MANPSQESAGEAPESCRFQSGDVVRLAYGGPSMTVVLAIDEEVYCEWLIGTERQLRVVPACLLGLVFRSGARP
jgi:uncharacterized protein YodC (DUF2158 family)